MTELTEFEKKSLEFQAKMIELMAQLSIEHKRSNDTYDEALRIKKEEMAQTTQDVESELSKEEPSGEKYKLARATELFPSELAELLNFTIESDFVKLKPKRYLGSENFAKIAAIVKDVGGKYVSAGKDSHLRIPLAELS